MVAGYGEDEDVPTDDEDEERPTKKRKLEERPSMGSQSSMRESCGSSSKDGGTSTAAFMRLLEVRAAAFVMYITLTEPMLGQTG